MDNWKESGWYGSAKIGRAVIMSRNVLKAQNITKTFGTRQVVKGFLLKSQQGGRLSGCWGLMELERQQVFICLLDY